MSIVSVAAVVVALAFVVLVAVMIPVLIEFKKTVVRFREFLEHAEAGIDPALKELGDALADVRTVADAAASRSEDVKALMTALGDTGKRVHSINTAVDGVVGILKRPASYFTGAKAAGKFLIDKLRRKEERPDERRNQ